MVFRRGGSPAHCRKNLFCYSSLLRFDSLRVVFLAEISGFGKKLAAGRGGVIARAIVLQKLFHRLQSLIVPVKDLQVLNRGRDPRRGVTKAGEIGKSPAADKKNQRQSPSQCRSKLSAGIEKQPGLHPFEPAR